MAAGLALALVAGAALACGPSFQAVYECDVRFEHCYALDQGPAAAEAKKECWRDWLHGYTFGQSSDRIEYAGTRFSELSLDPTLPVEEAHDNRPRRAHAVVSPMPTSAFAPPPNVMEHADAGTTAAVTTSAEPQPHATPAPSSVPIAAHPPGEECAASCQRRWNACRTGCAEGACDACDRSYRTCVPACFIGGQPVAPRSLR
ncbi:MAG TPA: hypothetical protein VIF15_03035 [Polyangiaceae bacterium]